MALATQLLIVGQIDNGQATDLAFLLGGLVLFLGFSTGLVLGVKFTVVALLARRDGLRLNDLALQHAFLPVLFAFATSLAFLARVVLLYIAAPDGLDPEETNLSAGALETWTELYLSVLAYAFPAFLICLVLARWVRRRNPARYQNLLP